MAAGAYLVRREAVSKAPPRIGGVHQTQLIGVVSIARAAAEIFAEVG
jgi:hypothetical protein